MNQTKETPPIQRLGTFLINPFGKERSLSPSLRYGLAVAAVSTAFVLRYLIHPFTGTDAPFILFVPAIIVSGAYCGPGPSLLASALSFALAMRFFSSNQSWIPQNLHEVLVQIVYIFVALVVVGLVHAVRLTAHKLQEEAGHRQSVEGDLRNMQRMLQAIIDNSPNMFFIKSLEGRYLLTNRTLEQIAHHHGETMLDKTDHELFPHEQAEGYRANDLAVVKAGKPVEFEEIAWLEDGLHIGIANKFPLRDAAGQVYAIGGIITDITARKRAEEALRHSEELLRLTTEGAGVDLWTWDVIKDRLECPTIHAPFGFDGPIPLEIYLSHIHPQDRGPLHAEVQRSLVEHRDLNIEFRVIWPDGQVGWRHSRGKPSYEEGRAVRLSGMSMDITKRKEAEMALRESEQLLRMTTEGAYIGLWSWEINTDTVVCNPIGYQQLGLPIHEKITLSKFLSAIHPEDRRSFQSAIEQCLKTQCKLNIEHRTLGKDGEVYWFLFKGDLTLSYDKPFRLSCMALEITNQKRVEVALEAARDSLSAHAQELEQRVAERTAQLQTSLRDMENFCYSIAHDLRAPLRGMRGFVDALEEDYGDRLDETARLYCERIRQSATRMDQLISDLLAFGRLSHLELPTCIVDLNEEIEKVLARSSDQINEVHAEIEYDKPLPKVCADAPMLDQVLENLIVNAVKFVPAERHPHVHIYAEPHNDNVRVWVEDNGIGIAPEHQNRIFGAFERLHTEEAYPGTGIGLAIVRRGVEKMGGHVGVESEPGKGSRFWIELPAKGSA